MVVFLIHKGKVNNFFPYVFLELQYYYHQSASNSQQMTKHTKKQKRNILVTSKLLNHFLVVIVFINSCAYSHHVMLHICYMVNFSVPKIVSRLYNRIKYINVFALYKRIPRNSRKIRGPIKSKIFGTVAYKFPKKSGSVCHYFTPPQAS